MKRHAGSPGSTPNRAKRKAARRKARERRHTRAQNVLLNNVRPRERDWVRQERTDRKAATSPEPRFTVPWA